MRKVILVTITFMFTMVPLTTIFAQTSDFTYQGSLKDGANPANANYDFEFLLYTAASGGSQIGSTNARNNVAVAAGVFSVSLDFGAGFPGADRFLEIRVRPTGGPGFTILTPRQKVSSAPYGIRSQTAGTADNATNATNATNSVNATNATSAATATNALNLGGVGANQFVQTTDPRLTDARPPTAGSTNYVQNTTTLQASTNFNISGNGTTGGTLSGSAVNTATDYLRGGFRFLGTGPGVTPNLFVGSGTGTPTGSLNTLVGLSSGQVTTVGQRNSFFGHAAGPANIGGSDNVFVGALTGGSSSISGNTSGSANTFIGSSSGLGNTTGSNNTLLGANTSALANNLQFATAIGAGSDVQTSNTVVLGRRNGSDGVFIPGLVTLGSSLSVSSAGISSSGPVSATQFNISGNRVLSLGAGFQSTIVGVNSSVLGLTNTFVGHAAGESNNISGDNNSFFGAFAGESNTNGGNNTIIGTSADVGSNGLNFATAIGAGAVVSSSNTIQLGRSNGSDLVFAPGNITANGGTFAGNLTAQSNFRADGTVTLGGSVSVGQSTPPAAKLHVNNGTDAEPGGGGYFVSGSTGSLNIVMDNNEIMARDNGATATLAINADGGNVHLIQGGTGNVGIGTTSPDQKLSVNGNASKTGGGMWAVFSDARLKNVNGFYTRGLDALKKLQPIRFEYRSDNALGLRGAGEYIGFSAQDVQKVLPEAVTTSTGGYLQLNADPILWTMLNGIKEQQAQIDAQQKQIEELKKQNQQQRLINDSLITIVCKTNTDAEICKGTQR